MISVLGMRPFAVGSIILIRIIFVRSSAPRRRELLSWMIRQRRNRMASEAISGVAQRFSRLLMADRKGFDLSVGSKLLLWSHPLHDAPRKPFERKG